MFRKTWNKNKGDIMGYPTNPETVVLRNKFYPGGLREIDIWNHYQKYKKEILNETYNRDLLFMIMVDLNKPVIRRKGAKGQLLRLTPQNYDSLITGRTLSIHSSMRQFETFGIIDIDVDPRDGFRWAQKVTLQTYDVIMDTMPFISSAKIRFTGGTSFHIVCNMGRRAKIDSIRFLLQKFLRESELAKVYTISGKRKPGIPNLDMAPNCFRCNYITEYALSSFGLRCMQIPYNQISSFNQVKAKI